MDRRIFQQYLYHKFLENVCRTRAAVESEFDEHFFQKRSEAVYVDIVVVAVSYAVMLGRPPARTPKGRNVARRGQRKNSKGG